MQEHFRPLVPNHIVRKYESGNTIIFQGEAPRMACVVVSGVVRSINISSQGEEQTINFHLEGDFFPVNWIFDKAPTAIYFYEASTDATVCFIPRAELLKSFNDSENGQELLVDYLATSYSAAQLRISALGQSKAKEKIILTLYYLCQRYGRLDNGKVTIGIKLTHQHIASLVGLTRETTATELNKLRRTGIVDYKNQKYHLDVQRLLRSIGEDSFNSIRIGNDD